MKKLTAQQLRVLKMMRDAHRVDCYAGDANCFVMSRGKAIGVVSARTVGALRKLGFVEWHGGSIGMESYALTTKGRAAVEKASGTQIRRSSRSLQTEKPE